MILLLGFLVFGQREKVSDFSKRDREIEAFFFVSLLFLAMGNVVLYFFDWVVGWLGQGMLL